MSAVAALGSCLGSAVCHRASAVPVHRRTCFAPLLSLPARPQRSRDRPLHPVDRVVEWVHRPRCLLHGLRRCSPLHRAYRVNSSANATRYKQPGQKSHTPALPENGRQAPRRPVTQTPQSARRLTWPRGKREPRVTRTLIAACGGCRCLCADGGSGLEQDLADVLSLQDPAVRCRCFGEGV